MAEMADTTLNLSGTFTPEGERGPSNAAELVEFINEQFINYWQGCGNLRLEIAGQERPDRWGCTGCDWKGPEPAVDPCGPSTMCPNCNDDVEQIGGAS